ncbi:MAG TPA: hypothetical protein VG963_15725 [Polyangiaceae bacterium]|nr:hypothetical protein [Polyangiaceae bacterium]
MTPHEINGIAAYAVVAALILLAPVIIAYLVVLEMLFYRLRHKHPEHYKEIGEPSLFLNNSISKSFGVVRYLLDKDYLVVPDERANKLAQRSRKLFFLAIGVFVVALLAFAVLSVTF